jgi:hypothetical protein
MNIMYDRDLNVQAVFYAVSEHTDRHHDTLPNIVRHTEKLAIEDIHLERDANGQVVVGKKQRMAATISAEKIAVGGEIVIRDFPQGVSISINGQDFGVWDEDPSVVTIEGMIAGFYAVTLSKRGFRSQEFKLEVVPG